MVVSLGTEKRAEAIPSYPMTEMSSGTRLPVPEGTDGPDGDHIAHREHGGKIRISKFKGGWPHRMSAME